MTHITDHLAEVHQRVQSALASAGRGRDETMLLAVSKQQPAEAIEAAFHAGQRHFGESYVQEALEKMRRLEHLDIEWHFIGAIQSNKTRPIAERFQWVHTVDRERIASRLNAQRPRFAPPLNVMIQVKQGEEPQKGGVEESRAMELAQRIGELPRLRLRGLMSIPPADGPPERSRQFFERLRMLKERLEAQGFALDALSMGMSADLELAIAEGATWVRVGTAIFGERVQA